MHEKVSEKNCYQLNLSIMTVEVKFVPKPYFSMYFFTNAQVLPESVKEFFSNILNKQI